MPNKYNKPKVIFIMHLPPPVHGAAIASKYIKTSPIINTELDAEYINLATNMVLKESGKASVKKLFTFFKIVKLVFNTLKRDRFDLCHMSLTASGLGFYKDLVIVLIVKHFGIKLIYHFHNKGVAHESNHIISRFLYRLAFKNTRSILLSPKLYSDVKLYVKEKDIFFCPYGIPEIPNISQKLISANSKECQLLYLSNMMVEKGAFVLLDGLKELKNDGFSFKCNFVGGWADIIKKEFNDKILELGLEEFVVAHGPKYGDEKNFFLKKADVFIFPTFYHYEAFPFVNLEAMQYSLPIVSTFEGGIPDMIKNGENGFLVSQKDSKQLAEKIKLLINNPELRLKMGIDGRAKYETLYTLDKFETTFLEIIKRAC